MKIHECYRCSDEAEAFRKRVAAEAWARIDADKIATEVWAKVVGKERRTKPMSEFTEMMSEFNKIKSGTRDIGLAIDAASTKQQKDMSDIWKMLKAINSSLQDIADAIRNQGRG